MASITYTDKVAGAGSPTGKGRAADFNEIKSVVNGKEDQTPAFTTLSGTTWDGSPNKKKTLTGNTSLTLSTTQVAGAIMIHQDSTGGRTLSINGTSVPINSAASSATLISFLNENGSVTIFVNTGGIALTGSDITAPSVVSVTVQNGTPTKWDILYDEPLDPASTANTGDFDVKINSIAQTVTGVSVSGSTVQLTVSPAMTNGDIGLVSFVAGANKVQDLAGNDAVSFTNHAVTNNVGSGDVTPPTVTSRTTLSTTVVRVVFSETVTATASGHSFKKNGASNGISLMTGSGSNTLDFTLSNAMAGGDTILHSYDSTTGNTIDAAANELVSFTDASVTNSLGALDSDAQTYITAEETLAGTSMSSGDKTAVSDLVTAFKSAGVWASDLVAGYPFLKTGTLNLRNPVNTDAGKRLTQGSGSSASIGVGGWTFNGTTDFLRTHIIPSVDMADFQEFYFFGHTGTGGSTFGGTGNYFLVTASPANGDHDIESQATNLAGNDVTSGRYGYGRYNDGTYATVRCIKNGTQIFFGQQLLTTPPVGGASTVEQFLGGVNNNGSNTVLYMTGTLKSFWAFKNLTLAKQAAIDTAIGNYHTAVGR